MLRFYDVDIDYVNYLRKFDSRVPYIKYDDREKFVCGVVLTINGCDYFAPISSKTDKQQTAMYISDDDGNVLSSIKFNYMFPAPASIVTEKDISDIRKSDPAYANLLQKEYEFCNKIEVAILTKAQKVHTIGCNPQHFLYKNCCNFRLLEEKSKDYFVTLMDDAFAEYDAKHSS